MTSEALNNVYQILEYGVAAMATRFVSAETTVSPLRHLTKLDKLQNEGSVRNYLDRRRDLYKIDWLGK